MIELVLRVPEAGAEALSDALLEMHGALSVGVEDAEAGHADERALFGEPGMAFGTGTHPTTRLCLRWLERSIRAGARVLDYGCGSGILAIGAARCGAGSIDAVDIDPQALEATRINAVANGVLLARIGGPDA